jgi:hypothetical protein
MAVPTICCEGPDPDGFMWAGVVISSQNVYPKTLRHIMDEVTKRLTDKNEYECVYLGGGLIRFSTRINPEARKDTFRKITVLHKVLSDVLNQSIVIDSTVLHTH